MHKALNKLCVWANPYGALLLKIIKELAHTHCAPSGLRRGAMFSVDASLGASGDCVEFLFF